jgi:carotenoid cleavage dioxygenase
MQFPDTLVFRGYAAPVRMEADIYELEVEGEIPPGLDGAYYRACADHCFAPRFDDDIFLNGDGMIHMLRLQNGHADMKTRYVRTEKFLLERAARKALFGAYRNPFTDDPSVAGRNRGTANTSAYWHAGRLFALKEDSRPIELDPLTLETRGQWDFGGKLRSKTFTAHPKRDPRTGEVIAFGYNTEGVASNIIEVFTLSPDGDLMRAESFEAPYPSMAHDFMISENYVAFTICPMICDWKHVKAGEPFFHWDSRQPTMICVFPRKEGVSAIRWFKAPFHGLETHTFNAWEEGSKLHLEHFFTRSGWLSQFPDINDPDAHEEPPFAYRWTVDLGSADDTAESRQMFAHIGEMPMIDPRFATRAVDNYYFGTFNKELGPMLPWGPKGPPFTCIGHFRQSTGALDFFYAGPDSAPEEPVFVPKRPDAPEGDGWLISVVGRRAENRTDFVILDSQNISAGSVATIKLPCRLHEGFHGVFVPAAELPRG